MKRFVALVAVFLFLFSIVPAAHAEQYTTLYATRPVNIRYGPSTQYVIIGELKTGEAVQYLGQSGKWYLVNFNGLTGYVHGNYLVAAQPVIIGTQPVTTGSYAVAQTNVNVRTGPSTKYGKLGAIATGQSAVLLGQSGNWLKIQWGSQTGYVYKKYFVISTAPTYSGTPTYPANPTYPLYPVDTGTWGLPSGYIPGYNYGYNDYDPYNQNSEFFDKLERSGYFTTNRNIYLGKFTDNYGIPCIRVANGTNLAKVASDLKSIMKGYGTFNLYHSTMPVGVNLDYINYFLTQISTTYKGLTSWHKEQLKVVGWGYNAARDAVIVEIENLNADKIEIFKEAVSSWPYIQFENPYFYLP